MADAADYAEENIERELAANLAAHRAAQTNGASAPYCIECDDVIPHQRRAAIRGVQLCVSCQGAFEIKKKRGDA